MKRRRNALMLLLSLLLTSCNEQEIHFAYGDGRKENDSIGVDFRLASSFSKGYSMKGTFFAESQSPLQERTYFSVTNGNPMLPKEDGYREDHLFTFWKKDLVKNSDSSYSLSFEVVFDDLEYYFKKGEKERFWFFIHGEGYKEGDITTYSALDMDYSFDGKAVKILDRQ